MLFNPKRCLVIIFSISYLYANEVMYKLMKKNDTGALVCTTTLQQEGLNPPFCVEFACCPHALCLSLWGTPETNWLALQGGLCLSPHVTGYVEENGLINIWGHSEDE